MNTFLKPVVQIRSWLRMHQKEARRSGIGLGILSVLVLSLFVHAYLHSPDRIARAAMSALIQHNAEDLLALTSEKERATFNLNAQNVRAYLLQTYWRGVPNRSDIKITGANEKYRDIIAYYAEVHGIAADVKHFEFEVYRGTDGDWHIGLTEILYIMPKVANGVSGDHARVWDAMAAQAGIKGAVTPSGDTRWNDGSNAPRISLTHDDFN